LFILLCDVGNKCTFVFIKFIDIFGWMCNHFLEVLSCPLDGMFDLIWEMFDSAQLVGFLLRIDDIRIAQSQMGDDYL
jgi:hypothetical protein